MVQICGQVLNSVGATREVKSQEDRVGFDAFNDLCSLVFFKFSFGVPIVNVHPEAQFGLCEIFCEVNLPTGPDDFFVAHVGIEK